jgi:hypothetical protein
MNHGEVCYQLDDYPLLREDLFLLEFPILLSFQRKKRKYQNKYLCLEKDKIQELKLLHSEGLRMGLRWLNEEYWVGGTSRKNEKKISVKLCFRKRQKNLDSDLINTTG